MKAQLCKAYGGPDDLAFEDIAEPVPAKGQVRIAIHAAGVNFPDSLIIAGTYQFKPAFPFSPGMEVAGEVVEVGEGVSQVAVGDRVMSTCGHGGYAEQVVAPESSVFRIPDSMDYVSAAGFPVTYGTTYHALFDRGDLKAGETLLVHGAAGGVGITAVELGRIAGARVIGTVGSDEKMAVVKDYGAEAVINYSTESIRDRVKELTGGVGADVIYDPVGGDAFDQSMRCINWQGRLLVVGFASGRIAELKTNLVLLKGCQIVGVFWGSFAAREAERNRRNFEQLLAWYEEGKLKPHISQTFALDQAPAALKALLGRKVTGKVVLEVRSST